MTGDGCNCYFSFWVIFALLPSPLPATPSLRVPKTKMKKKNEKNAWRYLHFTHVYQKLQSDDVMMYSSSDMVHDGQTDGRTDRKSDI